MPSPSALLQNSTEGAAQGRVSFSRSTHTHRVHGRGNPTAPPPQSQRKRGNPPGHGQTHGEVLAHSLSLHTNEAGGGGKALPHRPQLLGEGQEPPRSTNQALRSRTPRYLSSSASCCPLPHSRSPHKPEHGLLPSSDTAQLCRENAAPPAALPESDMRTAGGKGCLRQPLGALWVDPRGAACPVGDPISVVPSVPWVVPSVPR